MKEFDFVDQYGGKDDFAGPQKSGAGLSSFTENVVSPKSINAEGKTLTFQVVRNSNNLTVPLPIFFGGVAHLFGNHYKGLAFGSSTNQDLIVGIDRDNPSIVPNDGSVVAGDGNEIRFRYANAANNAFDFITVSCEESNMGMVLEALRTNALKVAEIKVIVTSANGDSQLSQSLFRAGSDVFGDSGNKKFTLTRYKSEADNLTNTLTADVQALGIWLSNYSGFGMNVAALSGVTFTVALKFSAGAGL